MTEVAGVILAAGLGTRMKSATVKVLHPVCGRPMLAYVAAALREAGARRLIAVVGHQADKVKEVFGPDAFEYAWQQQQLGTGHAVMQAEPLLSGFSGVVVVANGDAPLLQAETLRRLIAYHVEHQLAATVLTAVLDNPAGYGRVIRDNSGAVVRIVEHKDASAEELAVREVNTGMYAFSCQHLFSALRRVGTANAQGEFYLTDVLAILREDGQKVGALAGGDPTEVLGVNDRVQLAAASQIMRERILRRAMLSGVTIEDPATTYIDSQVTIGKDTVVHPHTVLAGDTKIGENCSVGPFCYLLNTQLAAGVRVGAATLNGCVVGSGAVIGPYVSLGPGAQVPAGMKL